MSRTSVNLSDRTAFTVNFNNGTAYFLDTNFQEKLIELSNTELINLCIFLVNHNILDDVTPEE